MTDERANHLRTCKDIAFDVLARTGDMEQAALALLAAMDDREDTRVRSSWLLGVAIFYIEDGDLAGFRNWIEGFR